MNYEIECQFLTPVNLSAPPKEDFEYSEMNCQATSSNGIATTTELIENASTGASFYLRQEISYGDILVITFLMLFLVFGILKFLTDFLVPKLFNWKRK